MFDTTTSRGLINPFSNKTATPQQSHDLLNFRQIGSVEFEKYVTYYILKQASIQVQSHKKQSLTFTEKKEGRGQLKQSEKDKRLVQKCLHKKMKWSQQTGQPVNMLSEQFISIPLAISTSDGLPRKGQKSNMTGFFEARYKNAKPPVIMTSLPADWVPECCFLEGMFLINTAPLGNHNTFNDYCKFVIRRFIIPRYTQGAKTVHVIFDNPGRLLETPKSHERKR